MTESNWWKHFCNPLVVNSHSEMPMPTTEERLCVPYDAAKIIQNAMGPAGSPTYPYMKIALMDGLPNRPWVEEPKLLTNDPLYREYTVDLTTVSGIDFVKNPKTQGGMDFFIVMEKKVDCLIDWGLAPWDGSLHIQRGNGTAAGFFSSLCSIDFLPVTRQDLMKWSRAHWGKRGDGGEFIKEMPRCLDYEKLKPSLSKKGIPLERILEAFDIRNTSDLLGVEDSQIHIGSALALASNPCDRFCEMFVEAPNAFWAERN